MPKLQAIFRRLRALDDPVVDHSMSQALSTADPVAQRLLVLSLLVRGEEQALAGVVRCFHKLQPQLQHAVVDHAGDLDQALRTVGREEDLDGRMNMIQIVLQSGSTRLAYLLASQLHHGDAQLTRSASAALLDLTRRATCGFATAEGAVGGLTVSPSRHIGWLAASLSDAAACFAKHGRQDVLLGIACLAPRRHPRLLPYLTEHKHHAHRALNQLIRQANHELVRRGLLFFAGIEPMEPAAAEALGSAAITPHVPEVMSMSHLLAVPRVRLALRKIKPAEHLAVGDEGRSSTAMTCRLASRWMGTIQAEAASRASALASWGLCEDAVGRLFVLRALMAMSHEAADEQIGAMCFDADANVARIALRHLIRRRWRGLDRLMARLLTSPHGRVRDLAQAALLPRGFSRFWDHWPLMPAATRRAAGRAIRKIDPQFNQRLLERMSDPDVDVRLRAVMMTRELGLETFFERRLLDLSDDRDAHVASAAVRALGGIGESSRVTNQLEQSLTHTDDRVRANAIESIQQLQATEQVEQALREMAVSGRGNRSRANAVRALLSLPAADAMPALLRMLGDGEASHRLSALWVVRDLGVAEAARRVAELAKTDRDPAVRREAEQVAAGFAPPKPADAELAHAAGEAGR